MTNPPKIQTNITKTKPMISNQDKGLKKAKISRQKRNKILASYKIQARTSAKKQQESKCKTKLKKDEIGVKTRKARRRRRNYKKPKKQFGRSYNYP